MHTSGQPAGCAGRPGHLLVTHARVGPPATGIVGSPTSDPLVGGRLGHLPVTHPFWLKDGAMAPTPLRYPPTKAPTRVRAHSQILRATAPRARVMTIE